jgi:hypothetical protein
MGMAGREANAASSTEVYPKFRRNRPVTMAAWGGGEAMVPIPHRGKTEGAIGTIDGNLRVANGGDRPWAGRSTIQSGGVSARETCVRSPMA